MLSPTPRLRRACSRKSSRVSTTSSMSSMALMPRASCALASSVRLRAAELEVHIPRALTDPAAVVAEHDHIDGVVLRATMAGAQLGQLLERHLRLGRGEDLAAGEVQLVRT